MDLVPQPLSPNAKRPGTTLSAAMLVALVLAPASQAVHDLDFELERRQRIDVAV